MAVYMTLLSFKNIIQGHKVQILSDNITTVSYLVFMRGRGRGTEQANIGHSNVYLVFCNREQYFDQFKASTRYRKRSSGQTVQTQMPIRMPAASQGFQTIRIQMGTIYGRQVCKSLERANTYIQQLVPRSNDFRCRCIQSKLGKSQQFH